MVEYYVRKLTHIKKFSDYGTYTYIPVHTVYTCMYKLTGTSGLLIGVSTKVHI